MQALANRVALLENEEKKLLGKIEDTKRKALEIMAVKKNARSHQEALHDKNYRKNRELEQNKAKAYHMKEDMRYKAEEGRKMVYENSMSKAEEVKQNLMNLRAQYKEKKQQDQMAMMHNVNEIKNFEHDLQLKKREKEMISAIAAKERYNDEIRQEQEKTDSYLMHIEKLEDKERDLIERLKVTQSQHQMVIDDLERIHENGQASGPLVSLSKEFEAGDFRRFGNKKAGIVSGPKRAFK